MIATYTEWLAEKGVRWSERAAWGFWAAAALALWALIIWGIVCLVS